MIQPNELRIGNWVSVYGEFKEIESVGTYGISFKGGFAKYTLPNFEPIPLTEEILLKCGFEKSNKQYSTWFNHYYYSYTIGDIKFHFIDHGGFDCVSHNHVRSLHILQNLYFALTGKELEVTI